MFDHGRRRLGELEHDARGRVYVEQVRVRQLLALQERESRVLPEPFVEGRRLMRILAVPEIAHLAEPERQSRRHVRGGRGRWPREAALAVRDRPERRRDRRVVAPRVLEGLARQLEAELL